MDQFRDFRHAFYDDWFHGTKPGSDDFSARWKQLATERKAELVAYEHLFIAGAHSQPFADRLQKDLGLGLTSTRMSPATSRGKSQFSTAPATKSSTAHFKRLNDHGLEKLTDVEIIERVYAERGRAHETGKSLYFSKSSPQVQKSVLKRFKNEQQDALEELAAEADSEAHR
jgi:type VI secretion system (T6SS) spike protein VgrG3